MEDTGYFAMAGPFRVRHATVVRTVRGVEIRAIRRRRRGPLVGIVNDKGQLVICEGADLRVIVEVPKA